MNQYRVYYVWWWANRFNGPELISGPHLWFTVPMHQANAMDSQVVALIQAPTNPYRQTGYTPGRIYYEVKTVVVNELPAPPAPNPYDPTLENLP